MGAAMAVLGLSAKPTDLAELKAAAAANEQEAAEKKDPRKRNSLAGDINDFVKFTPEELTAHIEQEMKKRKATMPDARKADPRTMKEAKIAEAVAGGNMRALRTEIITHFSRINKHYVGGWNGDTLMHIICREGYYKMAEFTINPSNRSMFEKVELDVNTLNDKKRSALHVLFTPPSFTFCAMKNGYDPVAAAPIEVPPESLEAANVANDWVKPGKRQQRMEILKLLLDEGIDVTAKDFHDYTAMHYASMYGWIEMMKMMMEHGGNIRDLNREGNNTLLVAVEYNQEEVVEFLLDETDIEIEARNADGDTALMVAIKHGHVGLVQMLCEFGSDTNTMNIKDMTPLKCACKGNHTDMVNILLDYKATRRKSAFDLLDEAQRAIIEARVNDERAAALAAAEAEMRAGRTGLSAKRMTSKSPFQQWVPYNDKRTKKRFFYNKVSRDIQWEEPPDYVYDEDYIVKDATYGMHFYH